MKHDSIYPHVPGHRGNRDTSMAAAADLAPKLKSMQLRIADAIRFASDGGLTADECGDATGILNYTCRARTAELRQMGWIRDGGKRRPNAAGRPCIVWMWVPPLDRVQPEPANDPAGEDICPTCGRAA